MRATGRIGDTEFEFEVPVGFEEMLRIDPSGFEIRYRNEPIFCSLRPPVNEPCNPCGHARDDHEDGLEGCSRCDCGEWWK